MKLRKKSSGRKKLIVILSALAVLVIVSVVIAKIFHLRHYLFPTPVVSSLATPTTALPPHPSPNNSEKQLNPTGIAQQQPGADQHGQSPSNSVPSDPSKWVISASGAITVKLPSASSTIQSGSALYGSSSLSSVQYRLIDDTVGVISQSTLEVVRGNFSGAISFTPHAQTGRLDVYNVDAQGREMNEVQIPVKF
jgi:hypothetical protein